MGTACSYSLLHPCTATDGKDWTLDAYSREDHNLEAIDRSCHVGGSVDTASFSAPSAACLACGTHGCGLCRVLRRGSDATFRDLQSAPVTSSKAATQDSSVLGQFFREALMEELLHPLLVAPKGWPLSQLLFHAVDCKQAFANATEEDQQQLLRLFFDGAKRPHTHRVCSVVVHSQTMKVSVEPRALPNEGGISSLPDIWRSTTRQKAASEGIPLAPGVAWHHLCIGQGSRHPERSGASTEVRAHVACPGNPRQLGSILSVFRKIFAATSGASGGSVPLHDALGTCMPRTLCVLESLFISEETDYRVSEVACGVQQHRIRAQWNLDGIGERFGSHQQHLWRGRPSYRLRIEGPQSGREWIAILLTESRNFKVEVQFYTTASGHLVWFRSNGTVRLLQDGQPAIVPNLLGSTFQMHVECVRLPIGTCGCSGAAELPSMIFSLTATEERYPIVSIRCSEVGSFPMEWFWAPLFDGTLMRMLLVRCFASEFHFNEDELHVHLTVQIPLLSFLLKGALKVFSHKIAQLVFSSVAEDPLAVLTEAFARDVEVLEQLLVE